MEQSSSMVKFVSIGEMAETTTQLLSLNLQYKTSLGSRRTHSTGLERIEQLVLQQARDYLADVREGFVLSIRAGQVTKRSELKFLLDRVLTDWSQLSDELGFGNDEENVSSEGQNNQPPTLERVREQLLAFSMAAIAFGQLPRLPADQITFPYSYSDPPTYSDIPTPDSPGETLVRIEEVERMLWQIMARDLQELLKHRYGALRRTYGFFEVSACLARKEAERFGLKKRKTGLALL